jgi:hypothetical protein
MGDQVRVESKEKKKKGNQTSPVILHAGSVIGKDESAYFVDQGLREVAVLDAPDRIGDSVCLFARTGE